MLFGLENADILERVILAGRDTEHGLILAGVAGLVVGVGEACVDGVVQVQVLAVPGGDDGVRGDAGVVAVLDGPFWVWEGGAGGQQGAVGTVEGDGAAGLRGDEVAAVVDKHVVVGTQAQEVVQAGPAAVAPVLDVVRAGSAGWPGVRGTRGVSADLSNPSDGSSDNLSSGS